jgi:uncharacterized membrane protein
MRRIAILLLLATALYGANVKLYLKDGENQLVREYQVLSDRVRYYSVERGDWEELPLELIDLARTRKEADARQAALAEADKAEEEETAAIRAERREIAAIPEAPGVYWIEAPGKLQPLRQAEITMVTDKKRQILKVLSPIPMIAGKSTAELSGETAAFRISAERPEFYFRLANPEGLAIVKVQKKKNARIAETINRIPVSEEAIEDRKAVPTFKKQIGDQLFKIWPEEPLEPGEYAVIEFTDGAANLQVWDFSIGK